MQNSNYYQGNSEHPRHLSVGAVVLNDQGEVCVHHIYKDKLEGYWSEQEVDDAFILMRETIVPGEDLERAVHRGVVEEFGIKGEIVDYIGSIQSHFKHKGVEIEKTTLYFLFKMESQDLSLRDTSDVEGTTDIEWHKPESLIPKMREQANKYGRTDIDESKILENLSQAP